MKALHRHSVSKICQEQSNDSENNRNCIGAKQKSLEKFYPFTPAYYNNDNTPTTSSSQLLSGPTNDAYIPREWETTSIHRVESDLISSGGPSLNDGSYFILDEGGNLVLDDRGSPARRRKWQPSNANQRARYKYLEMSTRGPEATYRWLPSVLISPDHLRVPWAQPERSGVIGRDYLSRHQKFISITTGGLGYNSGESIGIQRRREIDRENRNRRFLAKEKRRQRPKELDGFMLLEACGCDLPDEGRRADVSGRGLVAAVEEDLHFFTRLDSLDVGDNSLQFGSFACLPRLEELRFPCNGIRDIVLPIGSYSELTRLDLSYNNLSRDALSVLVRLPNLIDLDLTCNGLTELPETMREFSRLQKLSLERNHLEDNTAINVLSKLSALRELNLAFNYFTSITLELEAVENAFPLLQCLDLGFNYINREEDIVVLVLLERLQRVILYGNPLAGPTGEDPLGLCIKRLLDKVERRGERHPLEFITEAPRKKLTKDGRRRRPYSDMGITMVDEGCLPSASEFRAAGNRSLFHSEALFCDDQPESLMESTVQSNNDHHIQRTYNTLTEKPDATFITSMQKHDDIEKEAINNALLYGKGEYLGGDGMSAQLLQGPVDPMVRGDPVKLRMAMTALKHTLRHPVTSSLDVPWEPQAKGVTRTTTSKRSEVFRDTAAAVARQLPRRPYQLLKKYKTGFCEQILDGPPRSSNLEAIEEVLTSMNRSNDRMASVEKTRQDDSKLGRPELSTIIRKVNAVLDEC